MIEYKGYIGNFSFDEEKKCSLAKLLTLMTSLPSKENLSANSNSTSVILSKSTSLGANVTEKKKQMLLNKKTGRTPNKKILQKLQNF